MLDLLQTCEKNRQQDHSAIIDKLREFQSEVSQEQVQNRILQTLRFDGMYSREDNTSEASEGTFRWLLIKDESFEERYVRDNRVIDKMQATREAFLAWLESGGGVFHVCGKAGSGKSTLMKLICTDSKTRDGLKAWAGDETLLHASFFFFAPSEKEAKSLTGLYRCVLFTILNEHRDLMSKVYPEEFRNDYQSSPQFLDLIRPQRLEKAVQSLIDAVVTGAYKMCIFIDGLDEYEGSFTDYWELADRLLDWANQSSGRVKFCVSSRPEVQFVKAFGSRDASCIRQIHLHEFTTGDIEKHCHDQFANSTWFTGSDMVPNYGKFIDQIVSRAEGVFLWAVLVTKVLLHETRKDGFERDLWRRLEEIPDDINALYDRLFDSMGEEQERKCNLILLTILTNPFQDPIHARSLNFIYDEVDLDQALLQQQEGDQDADQKRQESRVVDNLAEWTRGLVEAISWDQAVDTRKTWREYPSTFFSSTASIDEDYTSRSPSSEQRTYQDDGIRSEETTANIDDNIFDDSDSEKTVDSSSESIGHFSLTELRQTPLFRTRVRLFHRTIQDYIQHSTSFRKLQSGFSRINEVETHAKLRLLEIGPASHHMPKSWLEVISDYAYDILEMEYDESVSWDGQISWSICKTIGSLVPSCAFLRPFDLIPFINTLFNDKQSAWARCYDEGMSLPHFAAFCGHPEAFEAQFGSGFPLGPIKDTEATQPGLSLLLSACLGRILHYDGPVHGGASNSGIITKVLGLGYSGHKPLSDSCVGFPEGVTVWHILIYVLSRVDPQSSLHVPSSVDQLLKVLAQLLESESPKEVLILIASSQHLSGFDSFITIQDVVESFPRSDSRDSLLRQLNDGPQYKSEKSPAWVHALKERPCHGRDGIRGGLQRLSPEEYSQLERGDDASLGQSVAVVSGGVFLKEQDMVFDFGRIRLW